MVDNITSGIAASPSQSTATGRSGNAGTVPSKGERHGPPITTRLLALIEARGLDSEALVEKYGVTASEMLGGEAIAIPYLDDGRQVGRKHRTLTEPKRFQQDKGSAQIFYNIDALRDDTLISQPLVITEGELDCWAALQSGVLRSVSVPGGAPSEPIDEMNAQKYGFVRHAEDADLLDRERVRDIVIAADNDANGRNLQHDLLLRLGASRCRIVEYPPACKDLNDVARILGADAVRACINDAQPARIEGWYEFPDWLVGEQFEAKRMGMDQMDEHYRPRLGDLTVISGIPGMGKSALVTEIVARMAKEHGWRFVWAPFETGKHELQRDLRTFHRGLLQRDMIAEDIAAADAWIARHFSVIVPSLDDEVSLQWFLETAAQGVLRFEAQAVIIDPWNEMDHVRPPDMTATEYTGFAIKALKRFAQKYRVHMIVVAHPAKLQRNRRGEFPVPSLYDIADSSHWSNKADIGIIVHRFDPKTPNTLLRIAKARFRTIGSVGDLAGVWDRETGCYTMGDGKEILGDDY